MVSQIKVNEIIKQSGSSITIGESGDTINIGTTGDTINLAGAAYAAVDNTPAFGASQSGTQTLSTGSWSKVTLDTENWDTDSAFDNSTNYRFTVPSGEGGKYLFNYGGYCVSMTTNGYFQLSLYKNGSELRASTNRSYMSSTATASMNITSSICVSLDAADYIEFYVIQGNTDGGGGDRTLGDSNYKAFLTGFKVIGA